jgi:Zn-finger nucleic acid-binding protein
VTSPEIDPTCPACGHPMTPISETGAVGSRCSVCAGSWFSRGEFARYLKPWHFPIEWDFSRPDRHATPPRPCPDCGTTTLVSVDAYPLTYARCSECDGIFVTPDELRAIDKAAHPPGGASRDEDDPVSAGDIVFDAIFNGGAAVVAGVRTLIRRLTSACN